MLLEGREGGFGRESGRRWFRGGEVRGFFAWGDWALSWCGGGAGGGAGGAGGGGARVG